MKLGRDRIVLDGIAVADLIFAQGTGDRAGDAIVSAQGSEILRVVNTAAAALDAEVNFALA